MLTEILPFFPEGLQTLLSSLPAETKDRLSEIRLRRAAPVTLVVGNGSCFIGKEGRLSAVPPRDSYCLSSAAFDAVFLAMCDYTLHRVMPSLREGYLTLSCGARVGVGYRALVDNGTLLTVGDVQSLNVRIPCEADGCSLPLLNALYQDDLPSVLVAGAPNSGKTTLLRDMARQLSSGFDGRCRKVTLVDERGEFAGDGRRTVGVNCDIVGGFPKAKGIEIAARTLSPELIVSDEIATEQEALTVRYAFASGVRFALSVHASDEQELLRKTVVRQLLSSGEFRYVVLLRGYTYQYEVLEVCDEADGDAAVDYLRYVDRMAAGTADSPEAADLFGARRFV